jgi:hypothetical protein
LFIEIFLLLFELFEESLCEISSGGDDEEEQFIFYLLFESYFDF